MIAVTLGMLVRLEIDLGSFRDCRLGIRDQLRELSIEPRQGAIEQRVARR